MEPAGCTARMREPPPARHHMSNRSGQNAPPGKRGSLPIWPHKKMARRASQQGRPGRPTAVSDAVIRFSLSIRVLFSLCQTTPGSGSSAMANWASSVQGRRDPLIGSRTPFTRRTWFARPPQEAQGRANRNLDWHPRYAPLPHRHHHARGVLVRQSRKDGPPQREDCPAACSRNETRHYGRAAWKRWRGQHARTRIETKTPAQVLSEPLALGPWRDMAHS